jgi:hypothetical protein
MGDFSSTPKPKADTSIFPCSSAAEPEPLRVGVALPLAVTAFLAPFAAFGDLRVGDIARLAALDAACASATFFWAASFCAFSRSFAAKYYSYTI